MRNVLLGPQQLLEQVQRLGVIADENDLVVGLRMYAMQEPIASISSAIIAPFLEGHSLPFKHKELSAPVASHPCISSRPILVARANETFRNEVITPFQVVR